MSDVLSEGIEGDTIAFLKSCRPLDPAEELMRTRIQLRRVEHENIELRATLRLMIDIAVRILDSSSED